MLAVPMTAALVAILLSACASSDPKSRSAPDSFQLLTSQDGKTYRIDRGTGRTWLLDGAGFREVAETSMPQLVVGKIYRGEDGKATFRYAGLGQLEPWGLDRYFRSDPSNIKP